MRTRNLVYLLSMMLVFSGFVYTAGASSSTTVSFRGGNVTIDLTFPEEAHPAESITHNVTITSTTAATLLNFTVVIKAPVSSGWQEIFNSRDTFPKPLPVSYSLPLQLPQEANGTLYCFMFVNTTSINYLSCTFYTTDVRVLTYNELLSEHNELLANYTDLLNQHNELLANFSNLFTEYSTLLGSYNSLLTEYDALNVTYHDLLVEHGTLNSTYNALSVKYDTLNSTYNSLLYQNNALQLNYNSLNLSYHSLQTNHNSLQTSYSSLLGRNNALQVDFNSLNSTYYSVHASFDTLRADYDSLNQTYTALLTEINDLNQRMAFSESALNIDRVVMFIFIIAVAALVGLIMYLKRKKQEPYLVIRKETVAIKPDEKPKVEPV